MAFRIETAIGAILILTAAQAGAQTAEVTHRHLHKQGAGTLVVTDTGLSYKETGKHAEHSRAWKYEQIQQLELRGDTLRLLTYEDQKWQLGRDRAYEFQ